MSALEEAQSLANVGCADGRTVEPGVALRVDASVVTALRALRTPQWVHYLPVPWACTLVPALGPWDAARGSVVAAGCLAYAYGVNAIADRHGDRSRRKNPLVGCEVVPMVVPATVALVGVIALVVAWLSGSVAAVAAVASLASGTLYSLGPRLKAVPFLSLVGNGGIFVPLVAVGLGDHVPTAPVLGLGALLGLLITQNQLIHEVGDADEDRVAGDRTTALVLGNPWALRSARVLGWFCVIAVLALFGPFWLGLAGAVSLGLVDLLVLAGCDERNAEARRRIHRYASVAVGAGAFLMLRAVLTPGLIFGAP